MNSTLMEQDLLDINPEILAIVVKHPTIEQVAANFCTAVTEKFKDYELIQMCILPTFEYTDIVEAGKPQGKVMFNGVFLLRKQK